MVFFVTTAEQIKTVAFYYFLNMHLKGLFFAQPDLSQRQVHSIFQLLIKMADFFSFWSLFAPEPRACPSI